MGHGLAAQILVILNELNVVIFENERKTLLSYNNLQYSIV